jgi:hypothetical protein
MENNTQKPINLHVNDLKDVLEIRTGEALPLKEPKSVAITGTLMSPIEYYNVRHKFLKKENCHVLYSYEEMFIKLVCEETSAYSAVITGRLKVNKDLEKFGINQSKTREIKDLKQFLKMNKFFFADQNENLKIVSNLEKFNANIESTIGEYADDRGNKKHTYEAKVSSNLDLSFVLEMPVFVGYPNYKFKIDICFDVRDKGVSVWLESSELLQIMTEDPQRLITEAIYKFNESIIDVVKIEQ